MLQLGSMSNCSKAARGLFALLRTDGIFTVNALSPSSSSRQYPYDYSIRAGQNLPDKEFRYLRTVIVTAAVHWGFSSMRKTFPLNLPAPGRRQPLYIHFRVSRDLCFW